MSSPPVSYTHLYGLVESGSVNGIWAGIVIVLSFTAGSAFLMWLGEQLSLIHI